MTDTTDPLEQDVNLFVMSGRLAAPVEHLHTEHGDPAGVRFLLTIRTPGRVDVVPVIWRGDTDRLEGVAPGRRLWCAGSTQRTFTDHHIGRRSQLQFIADDLTVREERTET